MSNGKPHSSKSAGKVEPTPKAISPGRVAGIGIQEVRYRKPDGDGKGYKAPMNSDTRHPRGSQGRH